MPAAARPGKSCISNRSRHASRAIPSSSRHSRFAAALRCTMRVDCGELDPGVVTFSSQKKKIFAIVPQRVSDTAKGENAGLGSERRLDLSELHKDSAVASATEDQQ
jgi:hypothetical protein